VNDDFDLDKGVSIDNGKKKTSKGTDKGPGKKKLIILSAIILIVLISASLILYLFLFKGKATKKTELPNPAESITQTKKTIPFENIWPMGELSVTLSGMSGGKTLRVTIELDLVNPETKDELSKRAVQIKSYIENLLVSKTVMEVSSTEGKIILRNEIIKKLNNTLDTGKVRTIYFTDFLII
jgi:flagellar FliL protein